MVLDLCPEFYVGGKENQLWHPENEETQELCLLVLGVPKVRKAAPATTVAPAAFSSEHTQHTTAAFYSYVVGHGPGRELSRLVQPLAVWQAGKFQLAQAEPRAH